MLRLRKSFSLVEMVIAAFLVGIAFVSLLQMNNYSLAISVKARELSTACEDAGNILEKFSAADFPALMTQFPNGCCVGSSAVCGAAPACPGASDIVSANELSLDNEKIEVSYPMGAAKDPLGVKVKISWRGKDGREYRDGGGGLPITLTDIDTKGM